MNCIYCHENLSINDYDLSFCVNHKYTVYYVSCNNNSILRISFESSPNENSIIYIYPYQPYEICIYNYTMCESILKTSDLFYISAETIDDFISKLLLL